MQSLVSSIQSRVEATAPVGVKSFAAWRARGSMHCQNLDALNWHLGDWILEGKVLYPDRAGHAALALLDNRDAWRKWAYVCALVPPENRRSELGFWWHYEVAPLNHDDQRKFLSLAVSKGWRKEDLRQAVRLHRGYAPPEDSEPKSAAACFQLSLDECRLNLIREFRERPLEKWPYDERLRLKCLLEPWAELYNAL